MAHAAFMESTINNPAISKRFVNKHQMQWTPERRRFFPRLEDRLLTGGKETMALGNHSPTFTGLRMFIVLSPLTQYLSVKNRAP